MKTLLFTVFISCLSLGFSQAKSDAIVGYWNTGENSSITEIYKQGNKYYGRLAYVVEASREKLDFKNPDASKRSRKILGLTFLENFVFDADDDEWEDGKIYNIQDGKSY